MRVRRTVTPLFLRSRSGAAIITGIRRGGNLHERLSAVAATRIHRLSLVLLEACPQSMCQEMAVLSVLRKSHVLLRARGGDVVRRDAYMLAMAGDNAGAGRPAPAGRSSGARFKRTPAAGGSPAPSPSALLAPAQDMGQPSSRALLSTRLFTW